VAIKQEVNTPLLLTVGVVSALLLLVIVFGTQAWFVREERDEIAAKWEIAKNVQLEDLRSSQRARIERSGGTNVPIEKAMQVLIQTGGKMPATQPAKSNKP
jgi:hypothetical protein